MVFLYSHIFKGDIMSDQNSLEALRHSAEHVLHQALKDLFPSIQLAMGPATEDGFYCDFDGSPNNQPPIIVTTADFPKIEKRMQEIIDLNLPLTRHEISSDEARQLFQDNPYKNEWLDDIIKENQPITVYWTGEPDQPNSMVDLCSGPHLNHTGEIKAFKLLSLAGAYWHGDEKNKMLTRIYGTAFPTSAKLETYLKNLEEAKKRDHRKLGKKLELFTFSNEVGQGLTLWLPKGSIIRHEIEQYMMSEQTKMDYHHVYSPHIGQKSLWEKSGHWLLYRDKMYSPMDVDGIEYLAKPMTCPMHIQTYKFKPRSYRDLPFRIAEIASVYRYEKSGELNGLLRVRSFTQDDAHVFCTQDQAVEEFLAVFNFIQRLYATFGFSNYRVRLGIRSQKDKYLGSNDLWLKAQSKAEEALKKSHSDYYISEGDAAFYGPKADFMIKDALGREWQCGTVQIDFMLPERFGLEFTNREGQSETPVMIHRAPLGSLERFLAILIEHYAGAFPLWFSPVQMAIIPIGENELDYAQTVTNQLKAARFRAELWPPNESLGKRIHQGEKHKLPYMLILGAKEAANQTVTVRVRQQPDQRQLLLPEFIDQAKKLIESKSIDL